MKDEKKLEVLLKVIQTIYDKNPEIREVIDASTIEVSAEKGVSLEQVFFIFLFLCCCLYNNGNSRLLKK